MGGGSLAVAVGLVVVGTGRAAGSDWGPSGSTSLLCCILGWCLLASSARVGGARVGGVEPAGARLLSPPARLAAFPIITIP